MHALLLMMELLGYHYILSEYYRSSQIENLRKVMESKEKEFNENIDYLMDGNARLRKKLSLSSDEEFSDDDLSIIEEAEGIYRSV
jgi:hypothetical protein